MKREQARELRRKKEAILAFWNRLAAELRGTQAKENVANLRIAGRLLEACQDKQGLFEERARRFLNESWRTYRRISDFLKAWQDIGEVYESRSSLGAKLSEPSGVNYQGYWRPPPWWDDPKNCSKEEFRAGLRKALEKLRGRA